MSDQTDSRGWMSSFFSAGSEEVISSKIPICAKYDDFYNLKHKNRGVAIIFNHVNYDDKSTTRRDGSDLDRDKLHEVLNNLEFDVRIYNDLKYGEIHRVLKETSEDDHTHNDCLLICVMSHGEEGKIYARDHAYPPDLLWEPFTNNCTTLHGKPKLFFIQACRGTNVDDGVTVRNRSQTDSSSDTTYVVPAMADILVMYSTYQGYYSWRSPSKGSWFIQALCDVLENHGSERDLLSMLTLVNRQVALDFQSYVPNNSGMHQKKQVCTIVSMLTRLMVFPKKKNIDC